MRVALLLGTFLAGVLWAGAARAQIEGNPKPPPLVDDTQAFGSRRPAETSVRFSIVTVKEEAILLDSSTGDTWRLVIADADAKSAIRWEPIARKPHAGKSRRTPKDKAAPPDAPPSDDGEVNPFGKRDEEPGNSPVADRAEEGIAPGDPNVQRTVAVRAQDIPKTVQIFGRLGRPLGSLLTVRGKWIKPRGLEKDPNTRFHVALVDGKQPGPNADLDYLQVEPISADRNPRGLKPSELWDWKFDWRGTEPSPTPSDGETWEMLGIETGRYDSYSEETWKELGGPFNQGAPGGGGFVTRFEYIAVRRVK